MQPVLKNIRKLAAGGQHCLALDESGTLYGWGSNSHMQLSHE
jgi:alpha-tubulin suppressor-like RCC1 family protein